jgi:sugar phosphate isomerase/epimerase
LLCSTVSVFAKPLREAFSLISEAGFDGVEVMVTKDPATQDPLLLQDLSEDQGLPVEAIHAPFLLMSRTVWGTDPVGKIYRAIELAEGVGAPLVIVHPPYRWQTAYGRWLDEQLPGLSAHTGVRVAVENMFPVRVRGRKVAAFHATRTLEDLEPFPHVVLDTSHAAVSHLDLFEALERLQGRLAHVHLSNNAGKGWDSHLPLDQGVLPLDRFLDTLAGNAFGGTVSLELDLRRYLDDDTALREVLVSSREFCEERLALKEA